MTLKRCKSCGGEYEPNQPGGYYHICPPHRLVPAGMGGPTTKPGDPGEYTDVIKVIGYVVIKERRDENADSVDGSTVKIKSEGLGAEDM